jgi:hypothetical protein
MFSHCFRVLVFVPGRAPHLGNSLSGLPFGSGGGAVKDCDWDRSEAKISESVRAFVS